MKRINPGKLSLVSLVVLFIISTATLANAREWEIVGARALGMGGAGVAVTNDSSATYWNPAAYGFFKGDGEGYYSERVWSAGADGAVKVQIHEDLGEIVDNILDINYDTIDDGSVSAADVDDLIELVNEINDFNANDSRAISVSATGAVSSNYGNFGLGGYVFTDVSASGNLDLTNIAPVDTGLSFSLDDFTDPANYGCSPCTGGSFLSTSEATTLNTYLAGLGWDSTQRTNYINAVDFGLTQASAAGETVPDDIVAQIQTFASLADLAAATGGGALADNQSTLVFRGIGLLEVPLTYGRAINDSFAIGGNVKYMKARVYNTAIRVFDTDFGDAFDDARDTYEDSSNFGLDLAMLYRFGDKLRFGLVARNVNSPDFDMTPLFAGDPDEMEEKIQVRAGAAFMPLDFITLALDIDLTDNDTNVSEVYDSRNICGGVEVMIGKSLSLRAGAYKNVSESDIGLVYTAGLGLRVWNLRFDVGGGISGDSTDIDGSSVFSEARVDAALSLLF